MSPAMQTAGVWETAIFWLHSSVRTNHFKPLVSPMHVALQDPRTGEIRSVKIGWSWTLYFFASFFGIPLFRRKLHMWGAIMLVSGGFWFSRAIYHSNDPYEGVGLLMFLASQGVHIYLAAKGNELTAKNLLLEGWVFVKPESLEAIEAKRRWGIQGPTGSTQVPSSTPAPSGAGLKTCPYCAEDIQMAAIKCKHCGSDLNHEQIV